MSRSPKMPSTFVLIESIGGEVFEQNFDIGVRVSVAPAVPPGEVLLPARLRYQACDASTCYIRAREDVQWTLLIVADERPTPARYGEVFDKIRFRPR